MTASSTAPGMEAAGTVSVVSTEDSPAVQLANEPDAPEPAHHRIRVGGIPLDPHRIIYASILLITAYAIYDEGVRPMGPEAYLELLALTVAPLVALTVAHAFSDSLDLQIRAQRRLTGHDRRDLFSANSQYFFMAIPPALLLAVFALWGGHTQQAVDGVQTALLISLGGWGFYAGRKAGVGVFRQLLMALNYFLVGLAVTLLELLLSH